MSSNLAPNRQFKNSFLRNRTVRTILRAARAYFFGKQGERRIDALRIFYRVRLEFVVHVTPTFGRIARRWETRMWVDGTESFRRIEKLIRRSKHTILIQMYIWKEDTLGRRMAAAVVDAARRGVRVTVLKEATGDVFELEQDLKTTQRSKDRIWQAFWNHPNITIEYLSADNHAKVYVIDGELLLLTGMNIADEYLQWHDFLMELRGTTFVNQFLNADEHVAKRAPVELIMNTLTIKQIRPAIESMIIGATRSIVIVHSYLSDPHILQLLAQKTKEGVMVTILLSDRSDMHHYANVQSTAYLHKHSNRRLLHILMYPGIIHGKLILVDREHMCIGSANLMSHSLDSQGEVNVLVHGKYRRSIQRIRDVIRGDILKSRPLTVSPSLGWIGKFLALIGL